MCFCFISIIISVPQLYGGLILNCTVSLSLICVPLLESLWQTMVLHQRNKLTLVKVNPINSFFDLDWARCHEHSTNLSNRFNWPPTPQGFLSRKVKVLQRAQRFHLLFWLWSTSIYHQRRQQEEEESLYCIGQSEQKQKKWKTNTFYNFPSQVQLRFISFVSTATSRLA